MLSIQTILHTTDFPERSGCAFQPACSLARDRGARVSVLHVMPVPLVQERTDYREEMAAQLDRLRAPDGQVRVGRIQCCREGVSHGENGNVRR